MIDTKSCFTCSHLYLDPDTWEMPWNFFWECGKRSYNNKWRAFPFARTKCEIWTKASKGVLQSRMLQAVFVLKPDELEILKKTYPDQELAFSECEAIRGEMSLLVQSFPKISTAITQSSRAGRIFKLLDGRSNPHVAEIGVSRGNLSRVLLETIPGLTLYLVDPWASDGSSQDYIDTGDDHALYELEAHEANYQETLRQISPFAQQVSVRRKPSQEAAKDMLKGSLDLVYIDADHSYSGCKSDITAWYPKVKPKGWIGGHDYGTYPGVTQAVRDHFPEGIDIQSGLDWFKRKER